MSRTDALELEYVKLWQECQINPSAVNDVKFYADKIQQHQAIYQSVSDITGVPWYVIAVIHGLESTFNFRSHLHNGDPLTARTVREPAGRPEQGNPPFTWNESAIDALIYDRATGVKFWTLANTLRFLEGYNGWGYRIGKGRNTTPPCRSPYIYSHTNHYIKGKYTADGHFDPDAVSKQVGCMAQLKELERRGLVEILLPQQEKLDRNVVGSVEAWQHILNGCGYYPVLAITGDMNSATVAMTQKFQKDLGLSVSGSVDLKTWQSGLEHKKLPNWSELIPPISKVIAPPSPLLPPKPSPPASPGQITQQLYKLYSQKGFYDDVFNNVMEWYGTTSNACVAFASTALRLAIDTDYVPHTENSEGNISLWTSAFSKYLVEEKKWKIFSNADLLQPGDVVFTKDNGSGDGIPTHVYVFARWEDEQAKDVVRVIDNQGFFSPRNIYEGSGGFYKTPFAYFLRDVED